MHWKERFSEELAAEGVLNFSVCSDECIVCHGPGREAEQAQLQARLNLYPKTDRRLRRWQDVQVDFQALLILDQQRVIAAAQTWANAQDDPAALGWSDTQKALAWLRAVPDGAMKLSPPVILSGDES